MEWASHALRYSPLEREVLASHPDNALVRDYGDYVDIDGLRVFVAVVPSSRPKEIPKLPPIVMLHGLGGFTYTFNFSSEMLHRTCDLVLIDLPGHGHSPDPPKGSNCFHPSSIAEIITKVIEKTVDPQLSFILFAHSYGTTHSLRISTGRLRERCAAVICVAPPYGSTIPQIEKTVCKYLPVLVFDTMFRARDRTGGLHSQSVNRMVSPSSGEGPRRHQLYVNLRSRSLPVLQTISEASFYDTTVDTNAPTCPVLIIGAADDKVCPFRKAEALHADLEKLGSKVWLTKVPSAGHAVLFERPEFVDAAVTSFLREHVDERLTLGWQLATIAAKDDKWSLKNETKWKNTQPIGAPLGRNASLRGMKVLREGDDEHGPQSFEESHPEVFAVIDISQDDPPYAPTSFRRINYVKFPTVSKIPPTREEVNKFIALVNDLNARRDTEGGTIAVHCHYGYNRTGFLICSYLISEEGLQVPEALQLYAKARPQGIRHQHFVHELYARYT